MKLSIQLYLTPLPSPPLHIWLSRMFYIKIRPSDLNTTTNPGT